MHSRLCKDTHTIPWTLNFTRFQTSHFPSQDVSKEGSKSRKSRVKAWPQAQSLLADADKIVRIRMPDVNKNAGPNRGVSTKGMNFLGMTDRRPRPPKTDGQPRSQQASNPWDGILLLKKPWGSRTVVMSWSFTSFCPTLWLKFSCGWNNWERLPRWTL